MRRVHRALFVGWPVVVATWMPACEGGGTGGQGPTTSATGTAQSAASGGPVPTAPSSDVAASPAGMIAAPVLRATLPGSWDENWFASPGARGHRRQARHWER